MVMHSCECVLLFITQPRDVPVQTETMSCSLPLRRPSTREITAFGPWLNDKYIRFPCDGAEDAQTLRSKSTLCRMRTDDSTYNIRAFIEWKSVASFFFKHCCPKMHYYQTTRRKRNLMSNVLKCIVRGFWDGVKPWCPQEIPDPYNLLNSCVIAHGSNQMVASRLR